MIPLREKYKQIIPTLKTALKTDNVMALPKLKKVVVSTGTGRNRDKKRNALIAERIAKITGQKSVARGAKTSIASFKLREGEIIGHSVTLRGERMYSFLDKLINVAIPRMRDFRGLEVKSIDEMGNYTMGIKEHTIFPETADEDLKDVFGLAVTIETSAKTKEEAKALFEQIGFPFKK